MNILLIHEYCARGGHCACMLELAKGLSAAGHPTQCFFFHDCDYFDWFASQCPATLGDADALRALLDSQKFDIIHGDSEMLDLPRILAKIGFRGRLAITRHGVKAPVGWHTGNCHAYIAESDTSAALMRPYTDLEVCVVPNFVDTNTFKPSACPVPPKPIIGWCGRSTEPFKDFPRYLRIISQLDPDAFEFRIADADAKSQTTSEHRHLEGIARIADWRAYSRTELITYFSQIAASGGCLLHTAHYEGLPMALLEAMSCGCPVVAADVRGVNDALQGRLRRWLYPEEASDEEAAEFLLRSLPQFATPEGCADFRLQVEERFSQHISVEEHLRVFAGEQTLCRGGDSPKYRKRTAANLWAFGKEVYREEKKPRKVLFAARAAVRFAPRSLFTPRHLWTLLQCGLQSRFNSANYFLSLSQTAFQQGNRAQGIRYRLHAIRLHPRALLG